MSYSTPAYSMVVCAVHACRPLFCHEVEVPFDQRLHGLPLHASLMFQAPSKNAELARNRRGQQGSFRGRTRNALSIVKTHYGRHC